MCLLLDYISYQANRGWLQQVCYKQRHGGHTHYCYVWSRTEEWVLYHSNSWGWCSFEPFQPSSTWHTKPRSAVFYFCVCIYVPKCSTGHQVASLTTHLSEITLSKLVDFKVLDNCQSYFHWVTLINSCQLYSKVTYQTFTCLMGWFLWHSQIWQC